MIQFVCQQSFFPLLLLRNLRQKPLRIIHIRTSIYGVLLPSARRVQYAVQLLCFSSLFPAGTERSLLHKRTPSYMVSRRCILVTSLLDAFPAPSVVHLLFFANSPPPSYPHPHIVRAAAAAADANAASPLLPISRSKLINVRACESMAWLNAGQLTKDVENGGCSG